MEYKLLDGKATSAAIRQRIAKSVSEIVLSGGKVPHLAAILVGDDGASKTYVENKEKACKEVGFDSTVIRLPKETTQEELIAKVQELNGRDEVDGIIVQLPLPKHINTDLIINTIDPSKDVDGFHLMSVGKMMQGLPTFIPATPLGIVSLLREYKIPTRGKHCVVIGRSNIVGRPMANLLSQKSDVGDCTVTICHSKTVDLKKYTRDADIIVAALGEPGFLKADMVKEGVVVIDVGITRVPDPTKIRGYHLEGDVDFEEVAPKCSYITPVPGGVGPMTIVSLLQNTLISARSRAQQ
ncbi:MAG: bifunctional 5,10-methylenetetrahydrofolate dehydrogenase/5,10-methenyltetrahydrofolate cyclohydrolase [Candidatus Egerieousia sp.]